MLCDLVGLSAEVKGVYLWLSKVEKGAKMRVGAWATPPPLMIQLGVLIVLRHSHFVGPL